VTATLRRPRRELVGENEESTIVGQGLLHQRLGVPRRAAGTAIRSARQSLSERVRSAARKVGRGPGQFSVRAVLEFRTDPATERGPAGLPPGSEQCFDDDMAGRIRGSAHTHSTRGSP
jgi:hypothetical protein